MNQPCAPILNPLAHPPQTHPSGFSQGTSPELPVSCIRPGLLNSFIYGDIHVSVTSSQIIPPLLSSTEFKSLLLSLMLLLLLLLIFFNICVSFAAFHIESLLASSQIPYVCVFFFFWLFFFFYCSELCHTMKWNSHGFTCVPHPDPPSHLLLYPIPLGFPSAPCPSTCLMHPTWAGDLFHPR